MVVVILVVMLVLEVEGRGVYSVGEESGDNAYGGGDNDQCY